MDTGKLITPYAPFCRTPVAVTKPLPDVLFGLELQEIYAIGKRMEQRLYRAGILTVAQMTNATRVWFIHTPGRCDRPVDRSESAHSSVRRVGRSSAAE